MRTPAITAFVLIAATADAAPRTVRFFATGSAGLGYYWSDKQDQPYSTFKGVTAPASSLFVGLTLTDHLALGVGALVDYSSTWRLESRDMTYYPAGAQLIWSIGAFADVYMEPARTGWHIQAFVGRGGLDVLTPSLDIVPNPDAPRGYTFMGGVGYDRQISRSLNAGALVRFTYGHYECCYDPVSVYSTKSPAIVGTLTWR